MDILNKEEADLAVLKERLKILHNEIEVVTERVNSQKVLSDNFESVIQQTEEGIKKVTHH